MRTLIIKNSIYNAYLHKEKNNRTLDIYESLIPEDSYRYLLANKTQKRAELISRMTFTKSITRMLY